MQVQHARRSELDKQHSKVRPLQPTASLPLCLPARRRAAETTAALRQGAASGGEMVDCGSMCMPGAAEKVQELVDDAVRKGAKVGGERLAGGRPASLLLCQLLCVCGSRAACSSSHLCPIILG